MDDKNHQRRVRVATDALAAFPALATQEVLSAIDEWVRYRTEYRLVEWKPITWEKNFRAFEARGPAAFQDAVRVATENTWQGLHPERYTARESAAEAEAERLLAERDWRAVEYWAFTVYGSRPPHSLSKRGLASIEKLGGWTSISSTKPHAREALREAFLRARAERVSVAVDG